MSEVTYVRGNGSFGPGDIAQLVAGLELALANLGIKDRNDPTAILLAKLEPISKSFEEHNEAGKLDKAEEIVGVVLPTNEDPALPLKPGEEALDEPASHVAA